jgi:hypothetical protein
MLAYNPSNSRRLYVFIRTIAWKENLRGSWLCFCSFLLRLPGTGTTGKTKSSTWANWQWAGRNRAGWSLGNRNARPGGDDAEDYHA